MILDKHTHIYTQEMKTVVSKLTRDVRIVCIDSNSRGPVWLRLLVGRKGTCKVVEWACVLAQNDDLKLAKLQLVRTSHIRFMSVKIVYCGLNRVLCFRAEQISDAC